MIDDPFSMLPNTAFRTITMQPADVLFRQHEATSGLYRVISGCVTLQRIGLSGDTLTLHRATAGGCFAEASIFSKTYHCDAICTQAGTALKVSKASIIEMMRANSSFSEGFTKLLAIQVQQYRGHLELLAIRSANERVLAAMQAGYLQGTVSEFASRINLTQEACFRALRVLCLENRIKQTGRGQYVAL